MINNKFNRYYANLRLILKEKQECLEFYDDTIKLNKLQKKADLNLFYQKPVTYLIRFLIYLPINLIRILKNANNHFYLIKLRNEVEILKFEIQDIQKKNG
jgi:hypothetical protein